MLRSYTLFVPPIILPLLFWFLGTLEASGQFVTVFTRQSQVDSFPILHPGVTSVQNLLIGYVEHSTDTTDIHDLTPLSAITKVYGDLYVRNNPRLKSLHGLHNVDSIFSYFFTFINNNDSLVDLLGLSGVKYIGRELMVSGNERLQSLKGLENITAIGALGISKNPSLKNTEGLENLELTDSDLGYLHFEANGLTDLSLPKLRRVLTLSILDEPFLKDLKGLASLDSIGYCHDCPATATRTLTIAGNNELSDFSGLEVMAFAQGVRFYIADNASLTDISTTATWQLDSLVSLYIINNPQLGPDLTLNGMRIVHTLVDIEQNPALETVSFPDLEQVNAWGPISDWDHPAPERLVIKNNEKLKTLDMPKLERVNRSFVLDNNPALENIKSLRKLREVKGFFTLTNNPSLHVLPPFEQFRCVGQYFTIGRNNLTSLEGLETLKFVGEGIAVASDSSLSSVAALYNLDSIGWNVPLMSPWSYGFLSIGGLPMLDTIHLEPNLFPNSFLSIGVNANLSKAYMPTIESVFSLGIRENPLLSDLSMPSLKALTGGLPNSTLYHSRIHNNASLTTLDGLSNIEYLKDSLSIRNNPALSDCEAICHMLSHGMSTWRFQLGGNDFPCNSVPDIKAHICDTLTAVHDPLRPAGLPQVMAMPNPTGGLFALDLPAHTPPLELTLTDRLGRVVFRSQGHDPAARIDIGHLPSGAYFIRAALPDGPGWVGKVVKR